MARHPAAGGEGEAIDVDGDGKPDVTFDAKCRFVAQLRDKKVVAIETDRKVTAHMGSRIVPLEAYRPVSLQDGTSPERQAVFTN